MPGRKFSTSTSAEPNEILEERLAVGDFRSRATLFLLRFTQIVGAPAVHEGRPRARVVAVTGILDLDHLRTHVAEEHRA